MDKKIRKEKRSKIYGHERSKKIIDLLKDTGKIGVLEKGFVECHILTCEKCMNRYRAISTAVSDK